MVTSMFVQYMPCMSVYCGIRCHAALSLRVIISDHIAPSFLITLYGLALKGIHNLAKRRHIVGPEQTAARGNTLEVVDAAKRRPGNRHTDKDRTARTVHKVANHRHSVHRHAVVDAQRAATQRMERVRYASAPNVIPSSGTVGI